MKKGQSITFLWIIAILIILFFSVLFIAGVSFIAAERSAISTKAGSDFMKKSGQESYLILERNLEVFLNRHLDYNGKNVPMMEFLETSSGSQQEQEIFRQNANSFFSDVFPGMPWVIRVANKIDDSPVLSAGDASCEPADRENNIAFSYFTKSKRIGFCMTRAYYDETEELKHVPHE
jgi:hypothetical protein